MEYFDKQKIIQELKRDAKALNVPSGAAEIFINYVMEDVEKSLGAKRIITNKDLERLIAKKIKKYNADLAYVLENRDRII